MSILVINPNTTASMTDGVKAVIAPLATSTPEYLTAPSGPPSINNGEDCHASADSVLAHLLATPALIDPSKVSGFLICCYSVHPLVKTLKPHTTAPVVGIFEASVATALLLLPTTDSKFGIVSTGKVWEKLLGDGVAELLGSETSKRFAGVETTGLNATELHEVKPDEVKLRMIDATKRLVKGGDVGAVCLGCAGMVGMEEWVREACVAELGPAKGSKIHIIDGVKVGYVMLEGLVKASKV
ncbi:hypothetical protein T439DRAFT_326564 [Meredithblackwellia eburnea MCA 4105]